MVEDGTNNNVVPVMVALRCRPLIPMEQQEGCQSCLHVIPGEPQVVLGKDRPFTYDFAFGPTDPQVDVYEKACKKLVQSAFKGFNATILAYGQTGSGKTFTMGGYEDSLSCDEIAMGVIPRIVREIFIVIAQKVSDRITVRVSYMEIYKEEIKDLLCAVADRNKSLSIREENGDIKIPGLMEIDVKSFDETMALLTKGANCRTTGATAMNNTSSRSHAVFTLHIDQESDLGDVKKVKFHLVDLAGSERVNRTGAEGERLKEGIDINKGLLALGNVISALGDDKGQKRQHIPYRNTKLTRILQDSLGGNSHTLMIACVSPADSNIEETLNTLRYADRARKIKNKPIINRDPQAAEIMRLKTLVQSLQNQLFGGTVLKDSTNYQNMTCSTSIDFQSHLTVANTSEVDTLKKRIKDLEDENLELTKQLQSSVAHSSRTLDQLVKLEAANECLKMKFNEVKDHGGIDLELLSSTISAESNPQAVAELDKLRKLADSINQTTLRIEEDDVDEGADEETSGDKANEEDCDNNEHYREATHKYTMRQAALQNELGELNHILSQKQAMADKIAEAESQVADMQKRYNQMLDEHRSKTSQLEKEKDELTSDLQNAKQQVKVTKVSDSRRLRIKELECKMTELKKEMQKHKKILKLKEDSDKQMGKLGSEIMTLKQQRVKLMKQMKEDASNFQKWKREKEKQVTQLQLKERKRQVEMVKMKKTFELQQTIAKRRNEEVMAANKRLQVALGKQKEVAAERMNKQAKCEASSIGNRVRRWLSQELEVKVSMKEAQFQLDKLIDERKQLTHELHDLNEALEKGPIAEKMSWLGDNGDEDELNQEERDINKEIKQTQLNIDLINPQIQDLQQKLVDADQDSKGSSTWQNLHTMSEAKCALKFLLDQAINAKTDQLKVQTDLRNAQDEGQVEMEELKKVKAKLSQTKARYMREIETLKHEHDKKILNLLNMNEPKGTKTLQNINKDLTKSLETNMKQVEELRKKLLQKEAELERLEKHAQVYDQLGTDRLLPDILGGQQEQKQASQENEKDQEGDDDSNELNSTFCVGNVTSTKDVKKEKRRTIAPGECMPDKHLQTVPLAEMVPEIDNSQSADNCQSQSTIGLSESSQEELNGNGSLKRKSGDEAGRVLRKKKMNISQSADNSQSSPGIADSSQEEFDGNGSLKRKSGEEAGRVLRKKKRKLLANDSANSFFDNSVL